MRFEVQGRLARIGGLAASLALALGCANAAAAAAPPAESAGAAEAPAPVPQPSPEVSRLTYWVIVSGDNNGLPFIVIDKLAAELFVYDGDGMFLATAPALLGVTPGDESYPVAGDRELSAIAPEERTTPAGRFVANFGPARGQRRVLWVDYATSISLHPVVTTKKKERRLQRLRSPTPEDNRITFGCINVPAAFYAKHIRSLFKDAGGLVYILPETKPLNEVFLAFQGPPEPGWDVDRSR
jgi:hypothetical protein